MALMSAHSGHSNSDSFHFLRFRNDSHVSLVITLASSSDSSGSASSIKSSSFSDSSASSSYSFLVSWSLFGVCAQITTKIIQQYRLLLNSPLLVILMPRVEIVEASSCCGLVMVVTTDSGIPRNWHQIRLMYQTLESSLRERDCLSRLVSSRHRRQ